MHLAQALQVVRHTSLKSSLKVALPLQPPPNKLSFSGLLEKVIRFPNPLVGHRRSWYNRSKNGRFDQMEKACVSMETRPRTRKRLSERIPEPLSDFALLIAGDTPSLAAYFFSIRGRVSGTEKWIELKSSVWRPSKQINFFVNNSARTATLRGDNLPLWLWQWELSSWKNIGLSRSFALNLFLSKFREVFWFDRPL